MTNSKPIILSIGGFDPCAGAGVLADVKTIESLGGYGMAVVSANTFQNESEFDKTIWIDDTEIIEQISVLERKHTFDAVKIGLIASFDTVISITNHINNGLPIVWDPVLKASAGFEFHSEIDKQKLNEVLKTVTIITPNIPEALQLFGTSDITKILALNLPCAVLLKGGHTDGDEANDVLLFDGQLAVIAGEKFNSSYSKHGTGCVLSSSIATLLAQKNDIKTACSEGKQYVETVMKSNTGLLGYHTLSAN